MHHMIIIGVYVPICSDVLRLRYIFNLYHLIFIKYTYLNTYFFDGITKLIVNFKFSICDKKKKKKFNAVKLRLYLGMGPKGKYVLGNGGHKSYAITPLAKLIYKYFTFY